jgi:hypothetical protein
MERTHPGVEEDIPKFAVSCILQERETKRCKVKFERD